MEQNQVYYQCQNCNGKLYFNNNVWECRFCHAVYPSGYATGFHYTHYQNPYQQWSGYPSIKEDVELKGLIPNRFDAIFYSGVGLFILFLFLFLFGQGNIGFYILMILIVPITIYEIYSDFKLSPRTSSSTLGNICAIMWIIIQVIIVIIVIGFIRI